MINDPPKLDLLARARKPNQILVPKAINLNHVSRTRAPPTRPPLGSYVFFCIFQIQKILFTAHAQPSLFSNCIISNNNNNNNNRICVRAGIKHRIPKIQAESQKLNLNLISSARRRSAYPHIQIHC